MANQIIENVSLVELPKRVCETCISAFANTSWSFRREPKLTVVTPIYNRRATIARTLASVEAQTLLDIEYIIVDDGSTDPADDVVLKFMGDVDLPCMYVKKSNGGVHTACNVSYRLARGQLVLRIDSDDELLPDACKIFWEAWESIPEIERKEYWQIKAQCVDADGNVTGMPFPDGINDLPKEEAWRFFSLAKGEQIGCRRGPRTKSRT